MVNTSAPSNENTLTPLNKKRFEQKTRIYNGSNSFGRFGFRPMVENLGKIEYVAWRRNVPVRSR